MRKVDHFFDINCMIGVWPYYRLAYSKAAELDEYMKCFHITGAAVSNFRSYRVSFNSGNQSLFEEIAPYPGMLPCPNLWPLIDGEGGFENTGAYLDMLRQEHRVKLVRVSPENVGFSVTASYFKPVLQYLSEHRMPMLIDLAQLPRQLDDVDRLCAENPDLRLVVLHQTHERGRGMYFMLKQYPNLYFETSFVSDQEELEQIVEYAGSGKLLWGSRMPHFEPGRMVARMSYSDLAAEDLQAIAYGNAERLMDEAR